MVIGTDLETSLLLALKPPPAGYSLDAALMDRRFFQLHQSFRSLQQQVAAWIQPDSIDAAEGHSDLAGIRPRRHHKIMFQVVSVGVERHVDTRVKVSISHLLVLRYITFPLGRIGS